MGSLRIVRDSGYADRLRKYQVIIDGTVVGQVSNGESKEFPVSPGTHHLWMKIDWCGSKPIEFTVTGREALTFDVRSNLRGANLFKLLWFAIFDRDSYLLLERSCK